MASVSGWFALRPLTAASRSTARSSKALAAKPIDGLRGKGDDLALGQGLHRLVDHVAQVVRVPEINHNGCHSPPTI